MNPEINEYRKQQQALFDDIERRFREGKTPSFIVEMRQDFEHDPARAITNVAFLPELAQNPRYKELMRELRSADPAQYFFPSENLHTTIKNVRVIHDPPRFTAEDIECIRPALREVAARHASFEIVWQGLLELPTSLAIRGVSSEACTRLVLDLHQVLQDVGVPDDKFYTSMEIFASSVTICRYTHTPSVEMERVIKEYKNTSFGTHLFKEFSLIACNGVASATSREVVETFSLSA